MQISKVILEDIYQKVKRDGHHAMDMVSQYGHSLGFNRRERAELFDVYAQYCDDKETGCEII